MITKIFTVKIVTVISCIFLNVLGNGGLKQPDRIEIPSSEEETTRIERTQTQDQYQNQGVPQLNLTGTAVGVEVILNSTLFA